MVEYLWVFDHVGFFWEQQRLSPLGDSEVRSTMPTTEPAEQDKKLEKHKGDTLKLLIGEQVLHTLGKPDGLYDVQVRRLWEDRYRVNVVIGESAASPTIANSYFVKADGDGKIVESDPMIKKQY